MDDPSFRNLLDAFNLSWEGYRKVRKGVKKRIIRHMHALSCPNMIRYLDMLNNNLEARQQCELILTVSISRFFRDTSLWATIEKHILPNIFHNTDRVKVWSACCANGEEVYSFKIVWEITAEQLKDTPSLEISATDLNPDCLKRAEIGSYTHSSLKELPKEHRNRFFDIKNNGKQFAVKSSLKKGIHWQIHHMLEDPPGSGFRIIFLRNNILTYYTDDLKEFVFNKVYSCLSSAGYLIIGSHEKLPYHPEDLIPMNKFPYVFKKVS